MTDEEKLNSVIVFRRIKVDEEFLFEGTLYRITKIERCSVTLSWCTLFDGLSCDGMRRLSTYKSDFCNATKDDSSNTYYFPAFTESIIPMPSFLLNFEDFKIE